MLLAHTMSSARGALDPLLHDVALTAIAKGVRVGGMVQVNSDRPGCARCDMDGLVLPTGPVIRISQNLGAGSRGCRLDAAGLEHAAGHVRAGIEAGLDLLIVNKFGKQEAAGAGFRPLIAEALTNGAAVLVGVNGLNRAALDAFTGGMAVALKPCPATLLAWIEGTVRQEYNP